MTQFKKGAESADDKGAESADDSPFNKGAKFADAYLGEVQKSERKKTGEKSNKVIDIIFGHVPTLSVVPPDVRESHLKELVSDFSDPERTYYLGLYSRIGEELTPSDRPKLVNLMLRSSWEEVVTRQKSYRTVKSDDILRLIENISELRDKGTYELLLVADTLLQKRQGAMWRRVNAWETIARVGQSLAVFRNWDLSLLWSDKPDDISRTSDLLDSLRGLGRSVDLSYYKGEPWIPKKSAVRSR